MLAASGCAGLTRQPAHDPKGGLRVTVIVLMNLDDVDIDTIANGIAAFYLTPTESRTRRRR